MDATDAIQTYLKTDLMRHLVHLKYLHIYADALNVHVAQTETGGIDGLMLAHRTEVVFWDAESYPDSELVLLPTASTLKSAQTLLTLAQSQYGGFQNLVLKFCDEQTRTVFARAFELNYAKATLSFTCDSCQPDDSLDDVMISHRVDNPLAALYARNGYTRAAVDQFFADGALAFTLYTDSAPACSCMVYRNFERVWEIGGLHTVEAARRRGYARRVVQKALVTLLKGGRIPRFQAEESNTASIRLAESLGMSQCLRFEHYTAHPKPFTPEAKS